MSKIKSTLILPQVRVGNYSIGQCLSNYAHKHLYPSTLGHRFYKQILTCLATTKCYSIFLGIKKSYNFKIPWDVYSNKNSCIHNFLSLFAERTSVSLSLSLFWILIDFPWNTVWKTLLWAMKKSLNMASNQCALCVSTIHFSSYVKLKTWQDWRPESSYQAIAPVWTRILNSWAKQC